MIRKTFLLSLTLACLAAPTAHADLGDAISKLFGSGQTMTIEHNSRERQFKMRVKGKIAFNAEENDVASLSGRALIQEKRGGKLHRVVFENDKGKVSRTYTVDGETRAMDSDGQRWLAEIIPTMIRETAMDYEGRIRRLSAAGGPDAVLAEIERIQADYARSKYIGGLARSGPLDDARLTRLVAAAGGMDSDYERRTALMAIVTAQPLKPLHQVSVLRTVAKLNSDYEQRQVLAALTPRLAPDAAVAEAWHAAAAKIDSDYELRQVIEALAKRPDITPAQLELALSATLKLDSDYEHASALKSLLRHVAQGSAAPPAPQLAAFMKSAQKINGDFERRNVLVALVNQVPLDKAGFAAALRAAEGMGSDFELRNVLTAIARKMPADAELVSQYRRIARRMGDHERGQAEKALDHLNM